MEIVAVIPARGGSQGVPLKNLEPVGGRPLVVRAVESCRSSRLVSEVVVSTDHRDIADDTPAVHPSDYRWKRPGPGAGLRLRRRGRGGRLVLRHARHGPVAVEVLIRHALEERRADEAEKEFFKAWKGFP